MPDPHELLGLPRSASREEITKRYRQLAQKTHPDKPGGDATLFNLVREAYKAAIAMPEVPQCEECNGKGYVETANEVKSKKYGAVFVTRTRCSKGCKII